MMWLAVVLTGAASYLLRALPLLLVDRVRISARGEEMLTHAAYAALTALLTGLLVHLLQDPRPTGAYVATVVGLVVGLVAAVRGLSMGRVAALGMAGYLVVLGAAALF